MLITRVITARIHFKSIAIRCFSISSVIQNSRLAEVGKLLTIKPDNYATGQLFLHKVFGYRGVILFPWTARVYDRDAVNQKSDDETIQPPIAASSDPNVNKQEVQKRTQTYYQVLIDQRDVPFIRAQTEAVTFLGNNQENSRSLYAIPGLDYVSHDDVLPYNSFESTALSHELFDKFLTRVDSDPPFKALDTLKAWQKKNHTFLELSDVHIETTNSIRITVIPFFMGKKETPSNHVYWWRYCIRLENLNPELSVQLRERHWRIFSLSGTLETVRGRGIVGQEPILNSRLPAFQYSSHVSLQAPSGHMWGTFLFHREDGLTFDCRIPPFSLESKQTEADNTQNDDNNSL